MYPNQTHFSNVIAQYWWTLPFRRFEDGLLVYLQIPTIHALSRVHNISIHNRSSLEADFVLCLLWVNWVLERSKMTVPSVHFFSMGRGTINVLQNSLLYKLTATSHVTYWYRIPGAVNVLKSPCWLVQYGDVTAARSYRDCKSTLILCGMGTIKKT